MATPELGLSEIDWKEIHDLEIILRPLYKATKMLQLFHLTPGCFYKDWKTPIFRLSQIEGNIADEIKTSMIRREYSLLENPILLAGIYVHPKYRILLAEDHRCTAKETLCDLAIRLMGFQVTSEYLPQHEIKENPSPSTCSLNSENEFEKFLDEQQMIQKSLNKQLEEYISPLTIINEFKNDFFSALNQVEKIDRFTNCELMEAIKSYPKIVKKAALVFTALPPTQVSVERPFPLYASLTVI